MQRASHTSAPNTAHPRTETTPAQVGASNGPWPLFDTTASRRAEHAALASQAPGALMLTAGKAVARLALATAPHAQRFVVFAGGGNNGGDGWVAATQLHQGGHPVYVIDLAGDHPRPADAQNAFDAAKLAKVPHGSSLPLPDDQAHAQAPTWLCIDALLGLGGQRAPCGPLAATIQRMNQLRQHGAQVLAVDLPSGLNPDTGQPWGEAVVSADATLALLTLKPGLFTGQGRDHSGQVWLDTLSQAPAVAPTAWLSAPPAPHGRRHAQHKGSFGDLWVLGGAPGMAGALWLAARAGLAAGAGRVYATALDPEAARMDSAWPTLMTRQPEVLDPGTLANSTVVSGCGGGQAIAQHLPTLLAHAARLVLDADALNAVAADPALQQALAARRLPTVLTPHPLEAARLLGCGAADVQADRLAAAQRLSSGFQATVLLKGSGTVVASPGHPLHINPTGNALLATAGTGDVLAGWLGGLWAQGATAQQATLAACWTHGHAADRAWAEGRRLPMLAARLAEAMATR